MKSENEIENNSIPSIFFFGGMCAARTFAIAHLTNPRTKWLLTIKQNQLNHTHEQQQQQQ